jgi:hypothetical protein
MKSWTFLFLFLTLPSLAEETSPFLDLPYYLQKIRYDQCDEFRSDKQVKIAILENSFPTFTDKDRETLPEDLEIVLPENNIQLVASGPNDPKVLHGKYVTQLIYLLTTRGGYCPELAPKLYLIPAGSFNKLEKAIDKAIELDVDFILHTNVHPYYGFGDGKGFLNAIVNRAVDAGITWVNAAGNFQEKIYQDKIKTNADGTLALATNENHIRLFCPKTKNNEVCQSTLVLQWNDFQEDRLDITDKLLEFQIYDHKDALVPNEDIKLEEITSARYPYYAARVTLTPGEYRVKINNISNNFETGNEFRFIVESEFTELKSINRQTNYILAPADNPRVVTVGASDASLSSQYLGSQVKPEYVMQSSLRDPSKKLPSNSTGQFLGSSISSTIFTALASMVKAKFPEISEDELLNLVAKRFSSNAKCYFAIDILSENKEFLRTILGIDLESVTFYPHRDGVRYLTMQAPHDFFGLPRPGEDRFIGLSPTGEPGLIRKAAYLSFIAMDGVVVDQMDPNIYPICSL